MSADLGNISDGYHTFNELYEHRHALFMALMVKNKENSFKTLRDDKNEAVWDGWFIAGMNLPVGMVTYHMPIQYFDHLDVAEIPYNHEYDGHDSNVVLQRILSLSKG
jgi:hypothetical protein